ncbi:MAG: hypothetical protein R3F34_17075 [Planctomycetota bacterium]
MSTSTPAESPATESETKTVQAVVHRVADDLAMIIDRPVTLRDVQVSRVSSRAAGSGRVHISFKLQLQRDGEERQGSLLIPLPDAIALSGYLMMMPDDAVLEHRGDDTLDRATKDAILEVGNFVGGAVDAALREQFDGAVRAKSIGCQGVRADVRPAFVYAEGEELLLARATARVHEFDAFELILMLPAL